MGAGDSLTETATSRLAAFSAGLRYEDIPGEVVTTVKHLLLDTIGASLAATTLGAGCREVIAVASALGGKPESTIFGMARKVGAPYAALANGALAHALNYDAIGPRVGHVGFVALPAPLAIAEAIGGVSGREFLAAATVASEVTSRVTAAQAQSGDPPSTIFLSGQQFGYFGAAAGAGRILGLDAHRMWSAFGLALMQTSGTMQVVVGGDPPAKAVYAAFPCHDGLIAALLARAGLGAEVAALEGPAGLYAMFYQSRYDPTVLTDGLGALYLLTQAQFKPWPTSGVIHPFIEAAGALVTEGVRASDTQSVTVIGGKRIAPWCEPAAERRRPANSASAANSIQFSVAKVLANGALTLDDFTASGIRDTTALGLTDRIETVFDETVRGGRIRVQLRNGGVREAGVEVALGHPSRPMSTERLISKFKDCCRHAAVPLSQSDVDRLVEAILDLERIDDVATLAMLGTAGALSQDAIATGRRH